MFTFSQVKTHLQSQANSSIAVGHQYKHQVQEHYRTHKGMTYKKQNKNLASSSTF